VQDFRQGKEKGEREKREGKGKEKIGEGTDKFAYLIFQQFPEGGGREDGKDKASRGTPGSTRSFHEQRLLYPP